MVQATTRAIYFPKKGHPRQRQLLWPELLFESPASEGLEGLRKNIAEAVSYIVGWEDLNLASAAGRGAACFVFKELNRIFS